jgi:hypothetical protein
MAVPVDVDPDTAREAAARELADPAYQAAEPSFLERVFERIGRFVADLLSGGAPGGLLALVFLVFLLVIAVVAIAVIRSRAGRLTRSGRAGQAVFETGRPRSAEEHREAAELARARGDLVEAVRERFRAIVRELDARGVLDERSGRTVDEIATQAGLRLPERAVELRAAATLFDDVVYGGHHPTEAGYLDLAALDTGLRSKATR